MTPTTATPTSTTALPQFGLVQIDALSGSPRGCLGQHPDEVLDDMTADQLRTLATDALAAADWLDSSGPAPLDLEAFSRRRPSR